MNLITVKSHETVTLAGITIEWERHNDNIKSIVLRDADGGMMKIINPGNYTDRLDVLIPQPPKIEERFVISGVFAGIAINKAFETEREAEYARLEFPPHADLSVKKMQVEISDSGEAQQVNTDNDLPF